MHLQLKVPERKAINVILLRLHRIKTRSGDNRPSFIVTSDDWNITIREDGKSNTSIAQHSEALIEFAIDYLKNNKKQGLMKRIGRCMGYLQVAAEIEALASGADKDAVVREALLRDFDNPPFKKVPAYWFHPGLTYLKGRI